MLEIPDLDNWRACARIGSEEKIHALTFERQHLEIEYFGFQSCVCVFVTKDCGT